MTVSNLPIAFSKSEKKYIFFGFFQIFFSLGADPASTWSITVNVIHMHADFCGLLSVHIKPMRVFARITGLILIAKIIWSLTSYLVKCFQVNVTHKNKFQSAGERKQYTLHFYKKISFSIYHCRGLI